MHFLFNFSFVACSFQGTLKIYQKHSQPLIAIILYRKSMANSYINSSFNVTSLCSSHNFLFVQCLFEDNSHVF